MINMQEKCQELIADKQEFLKEYQEYFNKHFFYGNVVSGNEECSVYRTYLQGNFFEVTLYDNELFQTLDIVYDMFIELYNIYINGFDEKSFENSMHKAESKSQLSNEHVELLYAYNDMATDRLMELVDNLCSIRRVGGAYRLLIAEPMFTSALTSAYKVLMENSFDDDMFLKSYSFIHRAALGMRN